MDRSVNSNGIFLHATQTTNFAVIAVSEEGYAEKYCQSGEPAGDLILQSWTRVQGTLFPDGKPVPDASIMLRPIRQLGGDNPHVQDNYQTRTDPAGKFVLSRVPPVPSVVSSLLTSWRDYPITSNQSIPLDLQPGETRSVEIGGDGLLINGVRPGRYRFLLKVYEPPTGCLVDPIGYGFLEFHTDDYAVNNNRIDLGTIDVVLKTIPKVGDLLSNFSWQDLNGKRNSLSDYQGQFVLLDFWATWCGPCIQAMPEIRKLHETSLVHQNLRVLSLSLDADVEKAKAFVREKRFEWSQGFVGDITASSTGEALGISSVPLYILLDSDGRIAARSASLQDKLLQEKLQEAAGTKGK